MRSLFFACAIGVTAVMTKQRIPLASVRIASASGGNDEGCDDTDAPGSGSDAGLRASAAARRRRPAGLCAYIDASTGNGARASRMGAGPEASDAAGIGKVEVQTGNDAGSGRDIGVRNRMECGSEAHR